MNESEQDREIAEGARRLREEGGVRIDRTLELSLKAYSWTVETAPQTEEAWLTSRSPAALDLRLAKREFHEVLGGVCADVAGEREWPLQTWVVPTTVRIYPPVRGLDPGSVVARLQAYLWYGDRPECYDELVREALVKQDRAISAAARVVHDDSGRSWVDEDRENERAARWDEALERAGEEGSLF